MRAGIVGLPRNLIAGSGRLLGLLLYCLAVPHRRLVRRNLHFCYPDWSAKQVGELSKRVFMHFGITFMEICQSAFMSQEELSETYRIVGEENIVNALDDNKGAIIVSAHIGNWEIGQHFSKDMGKPLFGVAASTRGGRADFMLSRLRNRFGTVIIDKKGALPRMTETIRSGGIVAFMIDQSRRKKGIEVTFFGRKATATPAAALLALRCKCPIVPTFCVREPDGKLTLQVKLPIDLARTGNVRKDVQVNTQRMMGVVEEMVRTYPDQWFWLLKPWKVAYPNLYSEWDKRKRKHKLKKKKRAASRYA
jgi:KDO2-lipid IV(A) lauroyltransferase